MLRAMASRTNLWLTWIAAGIGAVSLLLWLFSGRAGWAIVMVLAAVLTWWLMGRYSVSARRVALEQDRQRVEFGYDITAAPPEESQKEERP